MSRWLWGLLALSAAIVAVVLAIVGPGGSGSQESYARAIADGTPYAYIDKDIYNGEGPCDPDFIDDSTVEKVGSTHKLAVCIANLPEPVGGFELGVRYDDELDECQDEDCTDGLCLDDNPDANAGVTTWGGGLGSDWDCDIEGDPECDVDEDTGPQEGQAVIWCESTVDGIPAAAGDGESQGEVVDDGAWATLAVLTLDVAAAGTDDVIIDYLTVWGEALDSAVIGWCGADGVAYRAADVNTLMEEMPCYGATDIKKPPSHKKTPTPTVTATEVAPTPTSPPPATPPPAPAPTATATPYGGPGGIVIAPPPTGSGPSGGSFPWAFMASLLTGTAGAVALAGGFLRFAKR